MQSGNIPSKYICPITHSIMKDPIMNRHGVNYEKEAIFAWMQEKGCTDPLTDEPISPRSFISNAQLREQIETFCLHSPKLLNIGSAQQQQQQTAAFDALPIEDVVRARQESKPQQQEETKTRQGWKVGKWVRKMKSSHRSVV